MAMSTNILIGTSGYSYQDWVGPVYPAGTPARDFLRLYTAEFPFTELNFSYYRQLDARTMARMIHGVDERFRFAVKAYKGLTHEIGSDFRRLAAQFREGVSPLIEAGKLSAVVAQFPYSFHYAPRNRTHLQQLCTELAGLPLAVEFRNTDWLRESVWAGLRSQGVAFVNVDEPDLPGLPQPSAHVTAGFAYVRFHGRNRANWWQGDNASRYDYLYSDTELAAWVPRIQKMASGQAGTIMVAFNNHWAGQAVANARTLAAMVAKIREVA
jgi:uncharacterized protein YecE (DUF72 family)